MKLPDLPKEMMIIYLIGLEIRKKKDFENKRSLLRSEYILFSTYLNKNTSEDYEKCIKSLNNQMKLLKEVNLLFNQHNEVKELLKEYE